MSECSHPPEKIEFIAHFPGMVYRDPEDGDTIGLDPTDIFECHECGRFFDHDPSNQPEEKPQDENLPQLEEKHDQSTEPNCNL